MSIQRASASLFRIVSTCALVVGSAPLHADIIFTNITSPCCGGLAVNGANHSAVSAAAPFTPTFADRFAGAEVVAFQVLGFGGDPNFNLSLFSDSGGAPGSLIEQFGTDLTAPTAPGAILSATSALNPTLAAGTQYWLVLTPFDNNTQVGWGLGGRQLVPTYVTLSPTGAGGWFFGANTDVQYQIDGTNPATVPEPAGAVLLATALGLIGAGLSRRRLRLSGAARQLSGV